MQPRKTLASRVGLKRLKLYAVRLQAGDTLERCGEDLASGFAARIEHGSFIVRFCLIEHHAVAARKFGGQVCLEKFTRQDRVDDRSFLNPGQPFGII